MTQLCLGPSVQSTLGAAAVFHLKDFRAERLDENLEDCAIGAFGTRVDDKNAIECPRLKELGITLYVDERKNGQLCLQIRQDKPLRWRLKSLVMGRTGSGDIVYEPEQG